MVIQINEYIALKDEEIQIAFIHSAGPGGQNVNKVATACQLRFNVRASPSLSEELKTRLVNLAGRRINRAGVLVIEAKRYRTQEKNREDALQRLVTLILKALQKPKIRKATRPSHSAKKIRMENKKKQSHLKQTRRKSASDWE